MAFSTAINTDIIFNAFFKINFRRNQRLFRIRARELIFYLIVLIFHLSAHILNVCATGGFHKTGCCVLYTRIDSVCRYTTFHRDSVTDITVMSLTKNSD